jgi:hypothetical protein
VDGLDKPIPGMILVEEEIFEDSQKQTRLLPGIGVPNNSH